MALLLNLILDCCSCFNTNNTIETDNPYYAQKNDDIFIGQQNKPISTDKDIIVQIEEPENIEDSIIDDYY